MQLHLYIIIISFTVCQIVQSKHIGEIADNMWEWEGRIADGLGLTQPDIAEIKMKHDEELNLRM